MAKMTNNQKKNLQLLFDRPTEPVFMPKDDGKTVFKVPKEYVSDRYQPIEVQLASRFSDTAEQSVEVKKIAIPNMSEIINGLPRRSQFSIFIPLHRELAGQLIRIFLGMRNVDDLLAVSVYARDRVNPFLFNYALSVALLHRNDTRGMEIPNFMQTFPEKFIDSAVFSRVREELNVVPEGSRMPIEFPLDFTASDLEPENRLSYFREDIGYGLHHWHWHLVYPFAGPREIVAKDRRGEIFYYMHQQMIARYNVARFCNKLSRVERFADFRAPIKEAYFPKLDSLVASRAWPSRPPNARLSDIRRTADGLQGDLSTLELWRSRIFEAIDSGMIRNEDGSTSNLSVQGDVDLGIDVLGNMLEASPVLSPNYAYYGDLHNNLHIFTAYMHDPDHRFLESLAVMGDTGINVRDPLFYKVHAFVDDVFQKYKQTIPSYSESQLDFPGVTCEGVDVKVQGGPDNTFQTFWQKSDVNLSRGVDFAPRGSVEVRFTHLQHSPFVYRIRVQNSTQRNLNGTCRIFLAPISDERGVPMIFREHRLFFLELDKFPVQLTPGSNIINRRSSESNVTIPFERTFRNLDTNRPVSGDALEEFNFCGCGWPEHMLIPKGTPEGFKCVLFVMISDFERDRVDQTITATCTDAASYCGLKGQKYPDRRNMGFPFDRVARPNVTTLDEFLTPNMTVQNVTIRFNDRIEIRGQSNSGRN